MYSWVSSNPQYLFSVSCHRRIHTKARRLSSTETDEHVKSESAQITCESAQSHIPALQDILWGSNIRYSSKPFGITAMLLCLGHLQLQCHYSQFRLLNIVALGHATSFEPWSCDPTIYVIWVERIVNILQKYGFGNRTRTERMNRTLIPIKAVNEIRDVRSR